MSQWQDQSAVGNNALQSSSPNQPQLASNAINSRPALSFNGSDFMALPANMMQNVQAGEIIGVLEFGSDVNNFNTAWVFGTGNGTSYFNTTRYDDFGTADASGASVESAAQISEFYIQHIDRPQRRVYQYIMACHSGLGQVLPKDSSRRRTSEVLVRVASLETWPRY